MEKFTEIFDKPKEALSFYIDLISLNIQPENIFTNLFLIERYQKWNNTMQIHNIYDIPDKDTETTLVRQERIIVKYYNDVKVKKS